MKVWILSNLVDGYFETGLYFSVNFFWGEVTGQKACTQHTIKTATAVHPLRTLLKMTRMTQTQELKYLTKKPAMELMLMITAVTAPFD